MSRTNDVKALAAKKGERHVSMRAGELLARIQAQSSSPPTLLLPISNSSGNDTTTHEPDKYCQL